MRNQQRKQENSENRLFTMKRLGMFFDNYNTKTEDPTWTLRKEHMLMVSLSLLGTTRCDKIAEFEVFRGYSAKHLFQRTKNIIRFHSVKPLMGHFFDIYRVRDFFLDKRAAENEGFVLDKHHRYYHPTMSMQDQQLFFFQFELTLDSRETYQLLQQQLNTFQWNIPNFSRLSTIDIIVSLQALEDGLRRQIELIDK